MELWSSESLVGIFQDCYLVSIFSSRCSHEIFLKNDKIFGVIFSKMFEKKPPIQAKITGDIVLVVGEYFLM